MEILISLFLFILFKGIQLSINALILIILIKLFYEKESFYHYSKWLSNFKFFHQKAEQSKTLWKTFSKLNHWLWFSFGFVIFGSTILNFQEYMQVPLCVFGLAIIFLMHQWCAFIIGGQNQTVFFETIKTT